MEHKTCKALQVNSCTLKSAYKNYDDFYNVGYKKYRAVCEDFNKRIVEDILMKAKEFKMPYRLGTLRIKKKKMNYSKKNKLKINWLETNKYKKVIYHLNDHTDGFNYRWFWSKVNAVIKNKSVYSFQATRTNKRRLAGLLKNKKVDYFE
tara:strand:+ start:4512 stop:4958 length:447 start_codon:yes stop_codon:yes gene_type:complete